MTNQATDGRGVVLEMITQVLSDRPHLPADLDAETRLDDIGLDSVDLIVVFSRFEERWGVPYSDEDTDWTIFKDLGALADTLAARAHAAGKELR